MASDTTSAWVTQRTREGKRAIRRVTALHSLLHGELWARIPIGFQGNLGTSMVKCPHQPINLALSDRPVGVLPSGV